MNWATLYLACFLVGTGLSVLSFVSGSLHLPHMHLPLSHGHAKPHLGSTPSGSAGARMSFFNFATITAFLSWFGASGYLLTRYSAIVVAAILLAAIAAGLLGAAAVFWFVVKLLLSHDRELDPADYQRVGVLGRITSPIAEGGTGEIIFSLGGTRQTCGARSEASQVLPRGTEVIITRYDRGIAYVRRWDEMANHESCERQSNHELGE